MACDACSSTAAGNPLAMAVSFAAEFQRGSFIKEYYGMRRWAFPTMLIKVIPIWFFSILIVGIYYLMHMIFKVPMPEGIFNFILLTAVLLICIISGRVYQYSDSGCTEGYADLNGIGIAVLYYQWFYMAT